MPSYPHNTPLRASQRPGVHPIGENGTLDASDRARSPPMLHAVTRAAKGARQGTRMLLKGR